MVFVLVPKWTLEIDAVDKQTRQAIDSGEVEFEFEIDKVTDQEYVTTTMGRYSDPANTARENTPIRGVF
jgi:hypothetical protein